MTILTDTTPLGGKWRPVLGTYSRDFRADYGYGESTHLIDRDLQSIEDCKVLHFYNELPITINGKVYERVKAVVQWTKYRHGEELPEAQLYAYFTSDKYGEMLTDAAKRKLEKELETYLTHCYTTMLPELKKEQKIKYLEGHIESLNTIVSTANKHLHYMKHMAKL